MRNRKISTEFDALVALAVFGDRYEYNSIFNDYSRPWKEDPIAFEPCPAYSTCISDAWTVVEKLLTVLPNEDIHMEHWKDDTLSGWRVSTCFELGEWKDWVEAETLPMAICKVAIRVFDQTDDAA